jgi:excisionase family DNA binding protein
MKIDPTKKYLFPKEVANHFGVTLSTVRRWVKEGKLPAVQTPGGHSRILANEFYKLIKTQEATEKIYPAAAQAGPEKKLLIVDDNDDILTLLSTTFKNKGYNVATCTNGKAALDILSAESYPYILSDILMPIMDGRTLLGEVKKRYRQAKVIMMSSSRSYQILEFQLCGALDILLKPMGLNALYDTFKEIELEKRSSIRVPVHMPVTVNNTIGGTSVNISSDGILLSSKHPIAQGSEVKIQVFGSQEQPIFTTAGTVIRSSPIESMHNVAVYFMKNIGQELARLFTEHQLVPQPIA